MTKQKGPDFLIRIHLSPQARAYASGQRNLHHDTAESLTKRFSAWCDGMITRELGGFDVVFELPFKRRDVWDELLNEDKPLGVSSQWKIDLVTPGKDGHPPLSLGAVRRVGPSDSNSRESYTVKLVDLLPEQLLVWEFERQGENVEFKLVREHLSAQMRPGNLR